jgi:hypothetical protein
MRRTYSRLSIVAVAIATLVVGAAITEAFREGGLTPIVMVAWAPGVLMGAVYRPASRARCAPRIRRRVDCGRQTPSEG